MLLKETLVNADKFVHFIYNFFRIVLSEKNMYNTRVFLDYPYKTYRDPSKTIRLLRLFSSSASAALHVLENIFQPAHLRYRFDQQAYIQSDTAIDTGSSVACTHTHNLVRPPPHRET